MSELPKIGFAIPYDPIPLVFYTNNANTNTFLTITKEGKIVFGEGMSQDDATQKAAAMLAEQFSFLHQTQAAEIARLRAVAGEGK